MTTCLFTRGFGDIAAALAVRVFAMAETGA